jgi:hypothetical protein
MAANLRRLGGANVRFQDRLMGQAMAEVGREQPLNHAHRWWLASGGSRPHLARPGQGQRPWCWLEPARRQWSAEAVLCRKPHGMRQNA